MSTSKTPEITIRDCVRSKFCKSVSDTWVALRQLQDGEITCGKALEAIQRDAETGNRRNWRVGQLIAFVHGPGRNNIYRFRVTELKDGRPYRSRLV